jgi:hypothetical protein
MTKRSLPAIFEKSDFLVGNRGQNYFRVIVGLLFKVFRDYLYGVEMRVLYVAEKLQPSFPSPSHASWPSLVQQEFAEGDLRA